MRRIERLINLIAALLESDRPMTAEQIRTRIAGYDQPNFESFRRAFERDKDAVRAIGIPLETTRSDPLADVEDAYTIPKARYYLPDLALEPDEIAALKIASEILLGAGEHAGAALLKLSMESPSSPSTTPRVVWGANLHSEQPLLGPLFSAFLDRRPVTFTYRSARGEPSKRAVELYRLLHRNGHWYIAGRDRDRGAVRSFRVSRIASDIDLLEGSYEVPERFDATGLIGEAWEIGDELDTAIVRLDASMRWWAEQNMAGYPTREGPYGSLDLEMPVGNVDALISWAIGFGGAIEILSPESARARMIEHLSPILATARG